MDALIFGSPMQRELLGGGGTGPPASRNGAIRRPTAPHHLTDWSTRDEQVWGGRAGMGMDTLSHGMKLAHHRVQASAADTTPAAPGVRTVTASGYHGVNAR